MKPFLLSDCAIVTDGWTDIQEDRGPIGLLYCRGFREHSAVLKRFMKASLDILTKEDRLGFAAQTLYLW